MGSFDKDSFPSQDFNNTINKGENSKPKIKCAWTNEAFELWYLLHFNFYDTAISRDQYKKCLEELIRKKSNNKDYKYEKNSKDMFHILNKYGDKTKVVKNSEKLEGSYLNKSYSDHNPCTKVHLLIKELQKLSDA